MDGNRVHYAFLRASLRALGASTAPLRRARSHRRRRRRRGGSRCSRCAARGAVRRLPARRRLSRHARRRAVARSSGSRSRSTALPPAGTAGTPSSSSTACACATGRAPAACRCSRCREVDLIVAWTSLPLARPAAEAARHRAPAARDPARPRAGMLHVAGLEFDPARVGDDPPLTDWILRQPPDRGPRRGDHLERRPAQRAAARARSGAVAAGEPLRPPPVRTAGHAAGGAGGADRRPRRHPRRARSATGSRRTARLYVRLDYADIAALARMAAVAGGNRQPARARCGSGSTLRGRRARGDRRRSSSSPTSKAQLRADLPELELAQPRPVAAAGARRRRGASSRRARSPSSPPTGSALEPTDVTVTLRGATGGGAATGLVEFDRLQLAPLRELLARPAAARARCAPIVARYAPRAR